MNYSACEQQQQKEGQISPPAISEDSAAQPKKDTERYSFLPPKLREYLLVTDNNQVRSNRWTKNPPPDFYLWEDDVPLLAKQSLWKEEYRAAGKWRKWLLRSIRAPCIEERQYYTRRAQGHKVAVLSKDEAVAEFVNIHEERYDPGIDGFRPFKDEKEKQAYHQSLRKFRIKLDKIYDWIEEYAPWPIGRSAVGFLALKVVQILHILNNIFPRLFSGVVAMAGGEVDKPIRRTPEGLAQFLQTKAKQKVDRVKNLLEKIDALLQAKGVRLNVNLVNVAHIGHVSLRQSRLFQKVDLVTLELPDASVRPRREKTGEKVRIPNVFWRDVLAELGRLNCIGRTYGVNESEIRYYFARIAAFMGVTITEELGQPMFVPLHKTACYEMKTLGGQEEGWISYEQLIEALPSAARHDIEKKGIARVKRAQNPFGRKYLLLYEPLGAEVQSLWTELKGILRPLFQQGEVRPEEQTSFIFDLFSPIFKMQSDFRQIETALVRLKQHLETAELIAGSDVNYVHIGGAAHAGILEKYWRLVPRPRISVGHYFDYRIPFSPDIYLHPPICEPDVEQVLSLFWFDVKEKIPVFDIGAFNAYVQDTLGKSGSYFLKVLMILGIFGMDIKRAAERSKTKPRRSQGHHEMVEELRKQYQAELLLFSLSFNDLALYFKFEQENKKSPRSSAGQKKKTDGEYSFLPPNLREYLLRTDRNKSRSNRWKKNPPPDFYLWEDDAPSSTTPASASPANGTKTVTLKMSLLPGAGELVSAAAGGIGRFLGGMFRLQPKTNTRCFAKHGLIHLIRVLRKRLGDTISIPWKGERHSRSLSPVTIRRALAVRAHSKILLSSASRQISIFWLGATKTARSLINEIRAALSSSVIKQAILGLERVCANSVRVSWEKTGINLLLMNATMIALVVLPFNSPLTKTLVSTTTLGIIFFSCFADYFIDFFLGRGRFLEAGIDSGEQLAESLRPGLALERFDQFRSFPERKLGDGFLKLNGVYFDPDHKFFLLKIIELSFSNSKSLHRCFDGVGRFGVLFTKRKLTKHNRFSLASQDLFPRRTGTKTVTLKMSLLPGAGEFLSAAAGAASSVFLGRRRGLLGKIADVQRTRNRISWIRTFYFGKYVLSPVATCAGLFVPTPLDWVVELFNQLNVRPGMKLYDAGFGHGSVLAIGQAFDMEVAGDEMDPTLCAQTRQYIQRLHADNIIDAAKVRISNGDFNKADISGYDIIYVYWTPPNLLEKGAELLPRWDNYDGLEENLKGTRPGTKVVVFGNETLFERSVDRGILTEERTTFGLFRVLTRTLSSFLLVNKESSIKDALPAAQEGPAEREIENCVTEWFTGYGLERNLAQLTKGFTETVWDKGESFFGAEDVGRFLLRNRLEPSMLVCPTEKTTSTGRPVWHVLSKEELEAMPSSERERLISVHQIPNADRAVLGAKKKADPCAINCFILKDVVCQLKEGFHWFPSQEIDLMIEELCRGTKARISFRYYCVEEEIRCFVVRCWPKSQGSSYFYLGIGKNEKFDIVVKGKLPKNILRLIVEYIRDYCAEEILLERGLWKKNKRRREKLRDEYAGRVLEICDQISENENSAQRSSFALPWKGPLRDLFKAIRVSSKNEIAGKGMCDLVDGLKIKPGTRVLHIGCGNDPFMSTDTVFQGASVDLCQPKDPVVNAERQIEIGYESLNRNRKGRECFDIIGQGIRIIEKKVEKAKEIKDDSYDVVFLVHVLDDPSVDAEAIAEKALRSLKDGGRLVYRCLLDSKLEWSADLMDRIKTKLGVSLRFEREVVVDRRRIRPVVVYKVRKGKSVFKGKPRPAAQQRRGSGSKSIELRMSFFPDIWELLSAAAAGIGRFLGAVFRKGDNSLLSGLREQGDVALTDIKNEVNTAIKNGNYAEIEEYQGKGLSFIKVRYRYLTRTIEGSPKSGFVWSRLAGEKSRRLEIYFSSRDLARRFQTRFASDVDHRLSLLCYYQFEAVRSGPSLAARMHPEIVKELQEVFASPEDRLPPGRESFPLPDFISRQTAKVRIQDPGCDADLIRALIEKMLRRFVNPATADGQTILKELENLTVTAKSPRLGKIIYFMSTGRILRRCITLFLAWVTIVSPKTEKSFSSSYLFKQQRYIIRLGLLGELAGNLAHEIGHFMAEALKLGDKLNLMGNLFEGLVCGKVENAGFEDGRRQQRRLRAGGDYFSKAEQGRRDGETDHYYLAAFWAGMRFEEMQEFGTDEEYVFERSVAQLRAHKDRCKSSPGGVDVEDPRGRMDNPAREKDANPGTALCLPSTYAFWRWVFRVLHFLTFGLWPNAPDRFIEKYLAWITLWEIVLSSVCPVWWALRHPSKNDQQRNERIRGARRIWCLTWFGFAIGGIILLFVIRSPYFVFLSPLSFIFLLVFSLIGLPVIFNIFTHLHWNIFHSGAVLTMGSARAISRQRSCSAWRDAGVRIRANVARVRLSPREKVSPIRVKLRWKKVFSPFSGPLLFWVEFLCVFFMKLLAWLKRIFIGAKASFVPAVVVSGERIIADPSAGVLESLSPESDSTPIPDAHFMAGSRPLTPAERAEWESGEQGSKPGASFFASSRPLTQEELAAWREGKIK